MLDLNAAPRKRTGALLGGQFHAKLLESSLVSARFEDHMETQDAYSVAEFCRRNGISRATYYNLQRDGTGPRVMKVGARALISVEAATEWRRNMEALGAERPDQRTRVGGGLSNPASDAAEQRRRNQLLVEA